MKKSNTKTIAIIGGGLSGWTAALTLAQSLKGMDVDIQLVELDQPSNEVPWLLPNHLNFHARLGIDERQLIKRSAGTFTLGTQYKDWVEPGHQYFKPHGPHGNAIDFISFHHFAIKQKLIHKECDYEEFAFATAAAKAGKFVHPENNPQSLLSVLNYSHNIDPTEYLSFIQDACKDFNIKIITDNITEVIVDKNTNTIESVHLHGGGELQSDFYLDNSGADARLLNQLSNTNFVSWQQYLPFDGKITMCRPADLVNSKPLNNVERTSHGYIRYLSTQDNEFAEYIFDTSQISPEKAMSELQHQFERSEPFGTFSSIHSGRQESSWVGNCLAIGQSSLDFCPLELSSIQTVQESLSLFLELYPNKDSYDFLAHEYNRIFNQRTDSIRDYVGVNLTKLTSNSGLPVNEQDVPNSLREKLDLFKSSGKLSFQEREVFSHDAWAATLLGVGFWPDSYDPYLDAFNFQKLSENYAQMLAAIKQMTEQLPNHIEYLKSGIE